MALNLTHERIAKFIALGPEKDVVRQLPVFGLDQVTQILASLRERQPIRPLVIISPGESQIDANHYFSLHQNQKGEPFGLFCIGRQVSWFEK